MASFEENQAREVHARVAADRRRARRPGPWPSPARRHAAGCRGGAVSVWLGEQAIYQVMILSAGVAVGGSSAHRRRVAAAARPIRQWLRDDPQRFPGHAAHHATARLGAVLLLVRAVRDVDLHHRGGDQPPLPHHRHDVGALQRRGQLGGRRFRRVQRRRGPGRLRHSAAGPLVESEGSAHAICLLCGALGLVSIFFIPRSEISAGLDGRRGHRVGEHPRDAVRDPHRSRCRPRRWATTWACSISSS